MIERIWLFFLTMLLAAISPILCTCPASSQEATHYFTLDRVVSYAISHNWAIKAKEQRIQQAVASKKQALADFLPKLSTSYGYTRFSKAKKSPASILELPPPIGRIRIPPFKLSALDNYQWRASLTQPIFTGFALLSKYELARLGIDIASLELELEKLSLALEAKVAYFDVLRAQHGVELARKAVEALSSHFKVAKSFYEVGIIPINDLLKAEVELMDARHDLVKAENRLTLATSRLNTVMSRPVNAPLELEDMLELKSQRRDFATLVSEALKKRPELKVLGLRIAQAEQEIRLAKSKYFPEIVFSYNYIKEGDEPDVSGSPYHNSSYWEASAILTWTFWEWGKTHYQVREKEMLRQELIFLRKSIENQIRLEIKKAFSDLQEAKKNVPRAKKAIVQAEENLRVSRERYKAQVTTSTEVLDAQTLLTKARKNYYDALYDHKIAEARLLRALGMM